MAQGAPPLPMGGVLFLYKGEDSLPTEGFKFRNTKERTAGEAPGRKLQYQLFREQGSLGRVVANGTELRLQRTESQIIVVARKEHLEASKEGESRNLIPKEVKLWPLSLLEINWLYGVPLCHIKSLNASAIFLKDLVSKFIHRVWGRTRKMLLTILHFLKL